MRLDSENILRVKITIANKGKILEEIEKYLKKRKNQSAKIKNIGRKPLIIFTPNPEIISYAQKDDTLRKIVNSAQINIPDGWGVVWALKKLKKITVEKVTGVDFFSDLVKKAGEKGFTVGLIGGRGGVALKTRECLLKKYPGLKIEAFGEPEIEISNLLPRRQAGKSQNYQELQIKIIEKIMEKKVDILFVALGLPKQEYFIENVKCYLLNVKWSKPLVLMAVGGSFDYISGRVPRAPLLIRNIGLEWLFRLVREPWRFTRQIKGAQFFLRVMMNA